MKIFYEKMISNPKYIYGDPNIPPYIEYKGIGTIVGWVSVEETIQCIVNTNNGEFHNFLLNEIRSSW